MLPWRESEGTQGPQPWEEGGAAHAGVGAPAWRAGVGAVGVRLSAALGSSARVSSGGTSQLRAEVGSISFWDILTECPLHGIFSIHIFKECKGQWEV